MLMFTGIDRLDYAANEASIFRKIVTAWEPGLNWPLSRWVQNLYNNAPLSEYKNYNGLTALEVGGYCIRFKNSNDEILQIWLKGKAQLFSIEPKKDAGKRFIKHYLGLKKPEYLVKLNGTWVLPMRVMLAVASCVEAKVAGCANIFLDMAQDGDLD